MYQDVNMIVCIINVVILTLVCAEGLTFVTTPKDPFKLLSHWPKFPALGFCCFLVLMQS